MVSHKKMITSMLTRNPFLKSYISKFITYFIDGFTYGMKSIACLLSESQHIHRIWGLEVEVHSIRVFFELGDLQRMHGQLFFFGFQAGRATFSGRVHKSCLRLPKEFQLTDPCPYPIMRPLLKKLVGGALTSGQVEVLNFLFLLV